MSELDAQLVGVYRSILDEQLAKAVSQDNRRELLAAIAGFAADELNCEQVAKAYSHRFPETAKIAG